MDGATRRITEYLNLDLHTERWHCSRCSADLGSARDNYKKGCLVAARMPSEIHPAVIENVDYSFAPDPDWCRIVEFYCPECATLIEVEYLPPGHPITYDLELDIDSMKQKYGVEARS